jgi:putative copper resistance protein D
MSDLAWVVLRGAGLVLLFQGAGAALFAATFRRFLTRTGPVMRRTGLRAAIGALLAVAAQYLMEPVHLAGEWAGIAEVSLHRMVLGSSLGAALALRLAGLAGVAIGLAGEGPVSRAAALGGSLTALGSFALTGHTMVAAHRLWLAPLLLVHLFIAAWWFGSLWPLRQALTLEPREQAARLTRVFSAVAVWLVPLIPVAGLGLALGLLPGWAALLAPYGQLLMLKVALFAGVMALAAVNRLRLTPALARGEPAALPRLRRTVAAEYVLLCAVLAATAVLTGFLSPASADA